MPSYLDERERSTQRPDALMGDETPSTPTTLKTGGEAPGVDNPNEVPVMPSFVDELWGEDTTTAYSSSSAWSSKCTASNLPARSRNFGDLYSWVGSLFERRHQKRAERTFIKDYEEAVDGVNSQQGIYGVFSSDDPREIDKICGVVLICARSPDVKIQAKAFKFITELFIMFPSKFRSAFGGLLDRRKEISDVFILSWKRPGIEYSFDWLLWYNLASRCLTSQQNMYIEAATRTAFDYNGTVDFPRFEGLLSSSMQPICFLHSNFSRNIGLMVASKYVCGLKGSMIPLSLIWRKD
ncbi:hypothetical protein SCHPADRAFT_318072 [Schizopora paradoxa]|uniref:Uncharacterized protein n=1 Tax=Schizopora paradoxa TaxID=27342 RepID=A0A0H2SBM7_9AGAM|nr:hypothetical protein SCHPADRAFT_318072 [Schizopora paradoxa]